jgi:hypothetical protein
MRKAPTGGRLEIVSVCVPVPGTRMLSGMPMGPSPLCVGRFPSLVGCISRDPIGSNSRFFACSSPSFALLNRARARAPAFGLGTGTNSRWKRQSPVDSHRRSRGFSLFNLARPLARPYISVSPDQYQGVPRYRAHAAGIHFLGGPGYTFRLAVRIRSNCRPGELSTHPTRIELAFRKRGTNR